MPTCELPNPPTWGLESVGAHRLRDRDDRGRLEGKKMLYWAATFFLVAVVAAVLGFGMLAEGAATVAQVLFFAFVVLFLVALVGGLIGHRRVPD